MEQVELYRTCMGDACWSTIRLAVVPFTFPSSSLKTELCLVRTSSKLLLSAEESLAIFSHLSLIFCSQCLPKRVGPVSSTIVRLRSTVWSWYFTHTLMLPQTANCSPVYVLRCTLDGWSLAGSVFQIALIVVALVTESDAPVSTSIGTSIPFKLSITCIGGALGVAIRKSMSFSLGSSMKRRCVFFLVWLLSGCGLFVDLVLLQHTLARCPFFLQLWHSAPLYGQSLARCWVFPQR